MPNSTSREGTFKDSMSLNGIIAETLNFKAKPNAWDIITNKVITVDNSDAMSYFSLFVRDYTPDVDADNAPVVRPLGESADGETDHNYTIDKLTPKKTITSNFNDITQNIRLVDDNLKICANNYDEGTWKKLNDGSVWWESFKPPYITIFQNEGYIDYTRFENVPCKIAWNKNMGVIDYYHGVSLDGLLIFPYGPAIISMPNNSIPDEYGPYYRDAYDDDISDTPGSGGINHERYYTRYGKILGSMTAHTIGMVSVIGETSIIDDGSLHYNNDDDTYQEFEPTNTASSSDNDDAGATRE